LAAHLALGLAAVSSEAFLSASWYRLASLKPALKSQARIRRHRFRGEVWYVILDPASGRFNRFTPAGYQLLGLLDGKRTMDQVWSAAIDQLGDDTPSQDEVIRLLSQLYAADLLHCEATPDSAELFERFGRQQQSRRAGNLKNPFSIRIPLWDPDRFLTRTLPYVRPFLGWGGAALWCAVVGFAAVLAALNWTELTTNVSDRVLSAQNLFLLWVCFPAVKLLHELGHGYATKAGGGEVHEMGILLLVFMPVPYVDATASAGFRNKWQRAFVGAAGMITELSLAALFMVLWVLVEPGWVRAIAYNVVLIAGVSTIVFNANPLLRFDGYFILSDLIEIPNLNQRGNQYWRYLAERYLFRIPRTEPPMLAPGERGWFAVYTPAAFCYRMLVLAAIIIFIASEWFFIGVALAIWGLVTMLGMPLMKLMGYLQSISRQAGARQRAITVSALIAAFALAFILFVPMPLRVVSEGVVWLPEQANVRAGANGFVRTVLVRPGSMVDVDVPLFESYDPELSAQLRVQEARIAEMEAKLSMQLFADRVQAGLTAQELERAKAFYERTLERASLLTTRSAVRGQVMLEQPDDLPGRFVRKGQLMGYVVHHDTPKIVRAVVVQDDVDLVRNHLVSAEVRLAERPEDVYKVAMVREVPAARDTLPSAALSSEGGGVLAADPRDPRGGKSLNTTFQFDLELPAGTGAVNFGGRAHVRFVHQPEPLAQQWLRRLRQAFLARFNV
jgi:putative peptide zinc metalloprotease protein